MGGETFSVGDFFFWGGDFFWVKFWRNLFRLEGGVRFFCLVVFGRVLLWFYGFFCRVLEGLEWCYRILEWFGLSWVLFCWVVLFFKGTYRLPGGSDWLVGWLVGFEEVPSKV